jgi:hypothetical protein
MSVVTSPDTARLRRRLVRRETHSARTGAFVVAVLIAVAVLAYAGVEMVLATLGLAPLVAAPLDLLTALAALSEGGPAVAAGGVGVALVGFVLALVAVTPGRRARHALEGDADVLVIADNGVIAASLSHRVAEEAGLDPARLRVGVAHRRVDVTVRAEAGVPIDRERLLAIAERETAEHRLIPAVRTVVRIDRSGERS